MVRVMRARPNLQSVPLKRILGDITFRLSHWRHYSIFSKLEMNKPCHDATNIWCYLVAVCTAMAAIVRLCLKANAGGD
jgi:hypothetical protein